jgi:(E)-4-hydroxy-3-methyl-but-2-enyl pyrophosphate reductase
MKIELSKNSGFCMGVKNAVLRIIGEINSSEEEIVVIGSLIHNPQTISILHKRGLKTIDDSESITGQTVAIRTHGIPFEQLKQIKLNSRKFINLTCPRVARVQSIIRKYSRKGFFTVITGDRDHAEVKALKSYALSGVYVLSSSKDINKIPRADKYIVVSQTTFEAEIFENITSLLKGKFGERIIVFNTICDSTYNRQKDVRDAVKSGIDTIVVVGGKNSANTRRLAKMAGDFGIRTFHVETEEELDEKEFLNVRHMLVTAGASTPGWIINNVLEKLYDIKYKNGPPMANFLKNALEFAVRTNVISSIAAFFITLSGLAYGGNQPDYFLAIISSFYIFSMYTINNYMFIDSLKESNPYKYKLYIENMKILLPVSILFIILSVIIAFRYDFIILLIILGSYMLGITYSSGAVKSLIEKYHVNIIEKTYNSKSIVTSIGWTIITVIMPLICYRTDTLILISISAIIFCIVFFRNILLDLIAFQGDLIIGLETVPINIGMGKTKNMMIIISGLAVAAFGAVTIISGKYYYILITVNVMIYIILLFRVVRLNYLIALKYEFLVDANLALFIIFYLLIDLVK